MSRRGSVGKLSTSSWPTEENNPPELDGQLKHQKRSSIELKVSCTWSEEEEQVCWCCPSLIAMRTALMYIDRRCGSHTTILYHWEVNRSAENSCLR